MTLYVSASTKTHTTSCRTLKGPCLDDAQRRGWLGKDCCRVCLPDGIPGFRSWIPMAHEPGCAPRDNWAITTEAIRIDRPVPGVQQRVNVLVCRHCGVQSVWLIDPEEEVQ